MSSLSPLHTIGDQIGEALMLHHRVDAASARTRTIEMLRRVGFPAPEQAVSFFPFELSGGLRQRAMIAMALICRPAILIADEPTTALDVTIQAQILKLMKDLQAEFGMSILFISHDLGVVANIADEVVVLYRGRVMERGTCAELLERPQHPYLRALLRRAAAAYGRGAAAGLLREVAVDAALTLGDNSGGPTRRVADGKILEVAGLRKVFLTRKAGWLGEAREVVAVDDIGFSVNRGETLAIVGESGSGKTTVSKMIMRAVQPDQGRVVFHGADGPVDVLALDEAALQVSPAYRVHLSGPVRVARPAHDRGRYRGRAILIHDIAARPSADRAGEAAAAGGRPRRAPHAPLPAQLLGRAAAADRDCPRAGAGARDPDLRRAGFASTSRSRRRSSTCSRICRRRLGLTYLFVSHNLAVVKYVAQRIAVMCAGRMVELAPTDRLFANPQHPLPRRCWLPCRSRISPARSISRPSRPGAVPCRRNGRPPTRCRPVRAAFARSSRAFRPVPELICREQGERMTRLGFLLALAVLGCAPQALAQPPDEPRVLDDIPELGKPGGELRTGWAGARYTPALRLRPCAAGRLRP